MKASILKRAGVFLLLFAVILGVGTNALALSYIESGVAGNPAGSSQNTALFIGRALNNGSVTVKFYYNYITAPATTSSDTLAGGSQEILGSYTLGPATATDPGTGSPTAYRLDGAPTEITIGLTGLPFLTATADALEINLQNYTIKWSEVSAVNITEEGMTSDAVSALAGLSSYSFSGNVFAFEQDATLSGLISGTAKFSKSLRYYSQFGGFAATPEPAEWVLMFIGLGMLGFYLKRRGYLNFDLSPQSVA